MAEGYVLHRRRYRESSLIVELFTLDNGRISVVAKGALRRKNPFSVRLEPLQRLSLMWRGRGELKTLTHADSLGDALSLQGSKLYCAFYLNEIVFRLTARDDPIAELFNVYSETLTALGAVEDPEPVLRRFEYNLLDILGFGLQLDSEPGSGKALEPRHQYCYVVEHGAVGTRTPLEGCQVSGKALIDFREGMALGPQEQLEIKRLMRYVLQHYLGRKPLAARDLFAH